jgi:phage repressor protein C with HTH and peptisase S24 domain
MANWYDYPIEELTAGRDVTINPKGNSMTPRIVSGASVTLTPVIDPETLKKGDAVLVSIGRTIYVHLITAITKDLVQISNNHGHVNGWTNKKNVYGKVIAVDNHPKAK